MALPRIVLRPPGSILAPGIGNRIVVPNAGGRKPLLQGRRINQGLDGRTGLSLGKKGAVVWILPEIDSADGRQHIAGPGVKAQQGALQLRRDLADAFAQDPLGQPLQAEIHGRGDLQAALFNDRFSVAFDQLVADMGQVIRGRRGLDDLNPLNPQLFFLRGGDYLEGRHPFEDQVLAIADDFRLSQRVVAGGGLGDSGQQCAFGVGQFMRIFVEVEPRGLNDSPRAASEIDLVEIHLEDLLLAVFAFVFQGQQPFLDLPADRFLPGKVFVLDELLGDRRAAFGNFPFGDILHERARNPTDVDPLVLVKPGVFDGHKRVLQKDGNPVDRGPVSLLRQDPPHKPALVVEHPDGNIPGRKGRVGGWLFLGRRQRNQQQDPQESRGGQDGFLTGHLITENPGESA